MSSNNKITIEQAKQQITEGFSSIMTREDVLHLLDCLETNPQFGLTKEQVSELADNISNRIQEEGTSAIDDYDLSMDGHEVVLDSVDFNVYDSIEDAINDFLKELNND